MDAKGKAAVLVLRSLLEALVENRTLTQEDVLSLIDHAKAKSANEAPTRASRKEEEAVLEAIRSFNPL